jgi:hypothetical protein
MARAEEVGAAQASRETGVPAATLRAWRSRSRTPQTAKPAATVAASPVDGLDGYEIRLLERAKRAVELGVKRLEELIPQAKGVQSVAISSGILIDKVAHLNQTIADAQERQTRIAERDATKIIAAIEHYFAALELPFSPASKRLWATLLRQLAHGEPMGVRPPSGA